MNSFQAVYEKIQNVVLGNHISCIYRTKEELFSFLVPYYVSGLEQHNKCLFALSENSSDDIISQFANAGFDLRPEIEKQTFSFFQADDIYLKNGVYQPGGAVAAMREHEIHALKEGYTGLRVVGDVFWLKTHISEESVFMKYEASINEFIEEHEIVAACLYHEPVFEKQLLIDVLRTHPYVYLYDRLIDNKYFSATENFVSQHDSKSTVLDYDKMTASLTA